MLVDAHVHLYQYSEEEIENFIKMGFKIILSVAEDYKSSIKNKEIAEKFEEVYWGVGIHPWNVNKEEISRIVRLIEKDPPDFIGEVGLDFRRVPYRLWSKQGEIFYEFVKIAKELEIPLNIHCANYVQDILKIFDTFEIEKAIFHWYTDPININKVTERGYFVSFNIAAKIQEIQRECIKLANENFILTESDGPWNYRGIKMSPESIPELLKLIEKIKGENLKEKIYENAKRVLH